MFDSLKADGAHRLLHHLPNGHLHLSLLVAFTLASLIAAAIPISSGKAGAQTLPPSELAASTKDALNSAIRSQAETVTAMVASPVMTIGAAGPQADDGTSLAMQGVADLIPAPLLAATGKVAARGVVGSAEGQRAFAIQREYEVPFTLHENGLTSSQTSTGLTVGQALADVGIRLGPYDRANLPANTELTPGLHVYVSYATQVHLVIGEKETVVFTHADTVGRMLREQGIQLEDGDWVFPAEDRAILHGLTITLTTVRHEREYVDTIIDYDTVYVYDEDLAQGVEWLIEPGSEGYVRREYEVKRVNGEERSRELVAEKVVLPESQVVAIGTYVPPTPAPPPAAPPPPPAASSGLTMGELDCSRIINVWATYYTAASAGGSGITFTGTPVYKGIVAVDPNVIPLGTEMYIPGYGFGIAADTGGGVKGYHIDVAFGENDPITWSTRYVDICIL
jgi:resuscitation-promoting factor RpfB